MPTWLEWFAHTVSASSAPVVQRSVSSPSFCSFPFSQCQNPVYSQICLNPQTAGGICEALSAYWIRAHASNGSLWNILAPHGHVNVPALLPIINMQINGVNSLLGQDGYTFAWLQAANIVRTRVVSNSPLANHLVRLGLTVAIQGPGRNALGTTGMISCTDLAREIARDYSMGGGQYKKISLDGWGGAHTMAAWVANDIVYFDPNYGEYWFPDSASFISWFTWRFWYLSNYSFGLSGTYEVFTLARRLF
jgi:YopT-type cysteine protease-like protein